MTIRERVFLMILLPTVILLGILVDNILQDNALIAGLDRLVPSVAAAKRAGLIVHELQKERGASAGLIAAKGQGSFRGELDKLRTTTDTALTGWQEIAALGKTGASDQLVAHIAKARERLDQLGAHRAKVDQLQVDVAGNISFYSGLIEELIAISGSSIGDVDRNSIQSQLQAYRLFLLEKDRAGLERAVGAAILNDGAFNPDRYRSFVDVVAQQRVFDREFSFFAPPSFVHMASKAMSGPVNDTVIALRGVILDQPKVGNTGNIAAADWFKSATDRINGMKSVEDEIIGHVEGEVAALKGAAQQSLWIKLAGEGVLSILFALFIILVARSVVVPLRSVVSSIEAIASGDRSVAVNNKSPKRTEIGRVMLSLHKLQESLIEFDWIRAQADESEKEREAEIAATRERIAREFEASMGKIATDLIRSADDMAGAAARLSETSEATAKQSQTMAGAAEEASANVQVVADATEELSASVAQITGQVTKAASVASNAERDARATSTDMAALATAASKIGEIVAVITGIAEQTNLLALNATIEARRAGEQGRGFAVVAHEVKALASKTAKATEDIFSKITEIQGATARSVKSIEHIVDTVSQISIISTSIVDSINVQGAATREIASNTSRAAQGTQLVTSSLASVSRAVTQTDAASHQMKHLSDSLSAHATGLQSEVVGFVQRLREG